MTVSIENKLQIFNNCMADNLLTVEEKQNLEKLGITEELQKLLCETSEDDRYNLLEKQFCKDVEESPSGLPWYKSVWNVANKIIGGVAGAITGAGIGSHLTEPIRGTKIGLVVGVLAGIGLGTLTDFKSKPSNLSNSQNLGSNLDESAFFEILPATVDTVRDGDNLAKIAKRNGARISSILEANPDIGDGTILHPNDVLNIPQRRKIKSGSLTNLNHVAVATEVSQNYINDIIVGFEGKGKEPALKPYYDDVKDAEHPNGYLTIGFGHAGIVHDTVMTDENKGSIRITREESYEILTQDILNAKQAVINYIGKEEFENAPQSIQDALIDIAFCKGIELGFKGIEKDSNGKIVRKFETKTSHLKQDLKNKDYVSAAKDVVYNSGTTGLKRRNIYRIIMATRDLSPADRTKVMDGMQEYFNSVKNSCSLGERQILDKDWKSAYSGVCTGFFD
jgi:LysM repeat protein